MELTPTNRLVRKRNSNLQKRLEVTLQILGEEYRQTKERMYKDERDCGKFLQSLYSTVPGLHTYGQPNTRAMNRNAMLKERRISMSVSVQSGSDDEDHHNPLDPPFKPSGSAHGAPAKSRPKTQQGELRAEQDASGPRAGSAYGGSRLTGSDRNSLARKLRENNTFLNRPSTAGTQRTGQNPAQEGNSEKPGRFRQKTPHYGRNAYSDHDRFLHEKVLKRFDAIFDPETEGRRVNLNTPVATPIVVVEPQQAEGNRTDAGTPTTPRIPHPHVNVIKVNGEEFHLTQKPPARRRVIWSASPHKRQRAVSAPRSARTERTAPGIPDTTGRQEPSELQSSSSTALTPQAKSAATPPQPASPPPGRPNSRVQFLSLQKSLPAKPGHQDVHSDSSTESETDDEAQEATKPHPTVLREPQAKLPDSSKKQPCLHERRQCNLKNPCSSQHSGQQEQTQRKCHASNSPQTPRAHHPDHHKPNATGSESSKFLQVPGTYHQGDDAGSELNVPPQGTAHRHPGSRPASRLSDASDRTPPVELWSKLMEAGLHGRTSKPRPKTAPSKSELSHRSMPAPRQTVAGILAQIENQKASTRNLLNTSKELQRMVKNLVPWEQPPVYDLDDW